MPKAGGEVRNLRARGGFAPIRVHSRFPVARRAVHANLTPSFPLSASGEGEATGRG